MKILVVFTGGTISCSSRDGVLSPDGQNSFLLLESWKSQNNSDEFVSAAPYSILSENLTAESLEQLSKCISENLGEKLDGVIVTHGTDTLQYSAAYLGYKFSGSDIPIVLVSANYPLSDSRTNGFENFRAAMELIRSGGHKGVFAAYKNTSDSFTTIHRATRLLPHLPYDDSVFSVLGQTYGKIENGKLALNPDYSAAQDELSLSSNRLSGSVLYVKPYVRAEFPDIPKDCKAVLFEGWHSGTLPTNQAEFKEFCRRANEKNLPLFLTGSMSGFNYDSKQAFDELKIQVLPTASPIAMYMKLWLSQNAEDVVKPCAEDFLFNA